MSYDLLLNTEIDILVLLLVTCLSAIAKFQALPDRPKQIEISLQRVSSVVQSDAVDKLGQDIFRPRYHYFNDR